MALEFTVSLADRPGALAEMGYILEEAGVKIEAIHGAVFGGKGVVSFIASDSEGADSALTTAGLPFKTREVLVVNVLDQPGSLAEVALVMADAGVNIEAFYVMKEGQVVLAVDDLEGAIEVAKGMAVRD